MKGLQVGQINPRGVSVGEKDAFHVPAMLVMSESELTAGQQVTFDRDNIGEVIPLGEGGKMEAVIDPFITKTVKPYTPVWCFINPKMIGEKLVHHFEFVDSDLNEKDDDDYDDGCRGCY